MSLQAKLGLPPLLLPLLVIFPLIEVVISCNCGRLISIFPGLISKFGFNCATAIPALVLRNQDLRRHTIDSVMEVCVAARRKNKLVTK